MTDQVKISNKTRASFRRAGIRLPAKGHVIVSVEDLTEAQKQILVNDPNLTLERFEGVTEGKSKKAPKPKKAPKSNGAKKVQPKPTAAEAAHEKAMSQARKIKDPALRQAAQQAANAKLDGAPE
jgi:hypothetical protein